MKASNRKPLEIGYEIETIPYSLPSRHKFPIWRIVQDVVFVLPSEDIVHVITKVSDAILMLSDP